MKKERKNKKEKSNRAAFWLKGLSLLLAVMFIFTITSRVADSFTVAKVTVLSPSARRIQYTVSAEGRAEKNREISVITQPDILVKSVLVSEGQRVEKNEVLAVLDLNQLRERIDSTNGEIQALKLQNEAVAENKSLESKKRDKAISRARTDYKQLTQNNESAIKSLEKQIETLQKKYEKQKEKPGKNNNDIQALRQQIADKKKELSELKKSAQTEIKNAERALEDAMSQPAADNTADINNISIQNLNRQLQKLTALDRQKGKILAPKNGVITAILTGAGQKTADSGLFTMTDEKAGLKFVGQILPEDAKHISVGDTVSLKSENYETETAITSLKMDENKEFMNVSAVLPADGFSLGETVSMSATQESEDYPRTIPLSAIHQENGKYYVLLAESEDSVLEKQLTARKAEVNILEQNNTYAAIDADNLKENCKIIAETDRFVKAGDRVRLKEEEVE